MDKYKKEDFFLFGTFFFKNLSFKIAGTGQAGRRQAGGHRIPMSSEVYFLVNLFSNLYVTFILQWIAFIFGRDEEENAVRRFSCFFFFVFFVCFFL